MSSEYYLKNRRKLIDYVGEYRREMREIARDMGTCTNCFKEKDNPKFLQCSQCRVINRRRYKRYIKKNGQPKRRKS